ncbi:MAG: hypothetical protein KDE68_06690 [Rhodocyclaceae bacterium]|nr:hypothetical protein [Rhodocyclaceae bacterium]
MPKPPEQARAPHTDLHGTLAALAPEAIALYGIGMRARDLLGTLGRYRIAGLLDKDPANHGKTFFSHTVINPDQAVALGVRAIVIAATDVYWHTIARRIAPWCDAHDIAIVFPNGQRPDAAASAVTPLAPCCDARALAAAIAGHVVISFDLFETLVTRQALRPDDILALAAEAASLRCGVDAATLLDARKRAEAQCTAEYGHHAYPLALIYERLVAQRSLSAAATAALHASELHTERALCLPRPKMQSVLADCLQRGKSVWITTDTLLPRETIADILRRSGIEAPPNLLISSEQGLSKHDGGLFDILRARHPSTAIVHIGDNAITDIDQARRHGIAACRIPAPAEALRASQLAAWEDHAHSAADGQLLGLLAQQLFRDPFARPADGRVPIDRLHTFGYVFFGPLLLSFLGWLIGRLQKRPVEHLLFFAREGHLLRHLYDKLRSHLEDPALPAGTYFATSRRMSTVAALHTADDAFALLADAFTGSPAQLLRLRYGIDAVGEADDESIDNTQPRARDQVAAHLEAILANAADERAGYFAYLDRLGIDPQASIAVADLGLKGTIQHALQRMLGRPLDGYYITGWFGDHNPFGLRSAAALYPQAPERTQDAIYRYHILCESVLVAPHGMAVRADAHGRPEHAPGRSNQTMFDRKREIHAGVETFFDDFLASGTPFDDAPFSPALVDAIFASAMSPQVDIADGIKASFFVDEAYRAETERRIWD